MAAEMAAAARRALAIVRDVRERRGIDTQSPITLVLGDGPSLVATRFVFDYGWCPRDDSFFAAERLSQIPGRTTSRDVWAVRALRQPYDRPQRYVVLGRQEDCHVRSRTRPQRYEIPTRRKDCHVRSPRRLSQSRAGAPTTN